MSIAERKIREKEEVRALILKTTWKIVEQEGWQSLSMRKLAEAIEYSAPVIYSHFANKETLMLEFAKRGFQKLNEALEKTKASCRDPTQQIEKIAFAYLDFADKNETYYHLMYGLGMPGCEMVRETAEWSAFTEVLLDPIRKLIAQSKHRKQDPVTKIQAFWCMLHGLVSMDSMDNKNRKELNKTVLTDFVDNFIAGINR